MSFTLFFYSLIASTISLILISTSSIFFALPLLIKDEEIEKMCKTYFDGNLHMQKALMRDRVNAIRGLFLLSVGVFFQALSIILQMVI